MTEPKKWRVVVVDDHPLFRRGVVDLLLSTGLYDVVGEGSSAQEVAALVHSVTPDAVLLDIRLGTASGLSLIPSLRTTCPDLRIIVVTVFDDVAFQRSARAAGAHGFVAKRDADTKLQEALVAVLAGRNSSMKAVCRSPNRSRPCSRTVNSRSSGMWCAGIRIEASPSG